MRIFWYPLIILLTFYIFRTEYTTSFEPFPMWQKIFMIAAFWGITIFGEYLVGDWDKDKNKSKNENTIGLAVIYIETAAKFVKENFSTLQCNQITMWQYGNVGEGFIVQFYGFERSLRTCIEMSLDDIFGSWKISENSDNDALDIYQIGEYSYEGSWDAFNKAVWDEVQRKHPDWDIRKIYSHKYVLYV